MNSVKERIAKFNLQYEPFELLDIDNQYTLCFPIDLSSSPKVKELLAPFEKYARAVEVDEDCHGNGYDWEYVFKKAFANDENLNELDFDCEAGGFYCRCANLTLLESFGKRFCSLFEGSEQFESLVFAALEKKDRLELEEYNREYANQRLQGVCILNRDYKRVILEQSKNNGFIFLDPPYRGTEKYYNNIDFAEEEHARLFETMGTVDKKFNGSCKFLITYNHDPVIVSYAKRYGFDMYVVKRLHNMAQSTKPGAMFEELIIANYDLQAQAKANQKYIFEESRQLSLFDYNYYNEGGIIH